MTRRIDTDKRSLVEGSSRARSSIHCDSRRWILNILICTPSHPSRVLSFAFSKRSTCSSLREKLDQEFVSPTTWSHHTSVSALVLTALLSLMDASIISFFVGCLPFDDHDFFTCGVACLAIGLVPTVSMVMVLTTAPFPPSSESACRFNLFIYFCCWMRRLLFCHSFTTCGSAPPRCLGRIIARLCQWRSSTKIELSANSTALESRRLRGEVSTFTCSRCWLTS